MKLVFDDRALSDLEGIFEWIAKDNPAAALPPQSGKLAKRIKPRRERSGGWEADACFNLSYEPSPLSANRICYGNVII
jgi:plasmid stabilization system protein ParE